jgi:hypothetical protein
MDPEIFEQTYPQVVEWLRNYNGDFPIYVSFQRYFTINGFLTEKQRICVERALARDQKYNHPKTSIKKGDRFTIKTWLARKLAEQRNMRYFFRNLEVVESHKETKNAISVTVKFLSEVATCCHVCGRPLDTEISRACGIGPVCCENIGLSRPTLENAQQILKEIESKVNEIGSVGPLWIPKSQILQPHERDDEEARIALLEEDL